MRWVSSYCWSHWCRVAHSRRAPMRVPVVGAIVLQMISFGSPVAEAVSGGLAVVVVVDAGSAAAARLEPSKPTRPATRTIELRIEKPFPAKDEFAGARPDQGSLANMLQIYANTAMSFDCHASFRGERCQTCAQAVIGAATQTVHKMCNLAGIEAADHDLNRTDIGGLHG